MPNRRLLAVRFLLTGPHLQDSKLCASKEEGKLRRWAEGKCLRRRADTTPFPPYQSLQVNCKQTSCLSQYLTFISSWLALQGRIGQLRQQAAHDACRDRLDTLCWCICEMLRLATSQRQRQEKECAYAEHRLERPWSVLNGAAQPREGPECT